MTWIESHQTLGDHPKKDRLAEALFDDGIPLDVADLAAIGVLHRLWWWSIEYAADGDLSRFTDRQVAKGCRWNGDPKRLTAALRDAGFVDDDGRIHDWDDYAGKLLDSRRQAAERRAKSRERQKAARLAGEDGDAAGTPREATTEASAGRDALPYRTVPNRTKNPPVAPPKGGRPRRRRERSLTAEEIAHFFDDPDGEVIDGEVAEVTP